MSSPSYLMIVPSSCQMYSGTGTAIFDWIRFAKNDFKFSILMDTTDLSNYSITKNFCLQHDIKLYSSRGFPLPGCIDSGIRQISDRLRFNEYDFIECVSWANASTNLNVLASKSRETKLIFTPHSQPLWTLPDPEHYFMTSVVFKETLNASDFVFIDSSSEMQLNEFVLVSPEKIHLVPLGVDTEIYRPKSSVVQSHQLLCFCDCRERRKRVDLLIGAFRKAFSRDDRLRLVLGGKGSDSLDIPDDVAGAVTRLGYVEQDCLITMYQRSALFILLSDYEAFGLPVAEALCCGCPVLLNNLSVLESVFSHLPGVTFTNNQDIEKTAALICQLALADINRDEIAKEARKLFSFNKTYGLKRSILLGHNPQNYSTNDVVMIPFTETHPYPSYSQCGEDRIVYYLFERLGNVHGLTYADIGASVPAGHNNTYLFYTLGGTGLLVEADPMYLPAYQIVRPNDIVEPVAIIPMCLRTQPEITFYRMQDRGWSTVSVEHKEMGRQLGKSSTCEEITVPCFTINEILERHFTSRNLDLISLDIEGVDAEVIKDLDFNRFKPKVIIVENCKAQFNPNYSLFASTYINSIYVRQDCLDLLNL